MGKAGPLVISIAIQTWRPLARSSAAWSAKKAVTSFPRLTKAIQAAKALGEDIVLPKTDGRKITLDAHKDGRLIVEIERTKEDKGPLEGWDDKRGKYVKIFKVKADPAEEDKLDFNEFDKIIRAVKTSAAEHSGWMIREEQGKEWTRNPAANVKMFLQSRKIPKDEAEQIMGGAVGRSWKLVSLPFREEYPGGRQWNLDAAQFKIKPAELADDEVPHHPHWDMIFEHIGHELTPVLRELPWAVDGKPPNGGRLSSRLGGLRLPRSLPAAPLSLLLRPGRQRQEHLL